MGARSATVQLSCKHLIASDGLRSQDIQNESTRGGTTSGGLHVVLRIAAIGEVGRHHVEILRKLARGTGSLLTDNHVVPLWKEVHYEDFTFIVSPYVGGSLRECYGWWAKNSVGDIVDMILQALEESLRFSSELVYLAYECEEQTGYRICPRSRDSAQGRPPSVL